MNHDFLFETIKQLREELARVDHAIRQIEALAGGRGLRGRPPKAVAAAWDLAEGADARVPGRRRRRRTQGSRDNE